MIFDIPEEFPIEDRLTELPDVSGILSGYMDLDDDFARRLEDGLCEPCACGSGKSYLLCGKDPESQRIHADWDRQWSDRL